MQGRNLSQLFGIDNVGGTSAADIAQARALLSEFGDVVAPGLTMQDSVALLEELHALHTNPNPKELDPMSKQAALDAALNQIQKQFGKGSIMRMGGGTDQDVVFRSSGSLTLDMLLGGGMPLGRMIEIYGPESSGKTTLALHAIAEAQKKGESCAFIDAEHALDPIYARKIGVDVDNLLLSQPDGGEQALEIVDALVRSNAVGSIVIDSVAALVPRAELEGEMGDTHVGLHARLMSQALRKLTGSVSKSRCNLIFLNQLRLKIGVMFGNPETTTGGNALKFYASQRIDIRRKESIKDGDNIIGNVTNLKIIKNKVAPPFRTGTVDIMYGEGVSRSGELVDLGVQFGIVEKTGAWFAVNNQKIGQGREKAKKTIAENKQLADQIEKAIRNKMGTASKVLEMDPRDIAAAKADGADGEEERAA